MHSTSRAKDFDDAWRWASTDSGNTSDTGVDQRSICEVVTQKLIYRS